GGGQEPEGAVPRAEVAGADGDDDVAVFEEPAPARLVEVAAEGAGGVFAAGEPDRFGVPVGFGQPEGARRVVEGDVEPAGRRPSSTTPDRWPSSCEVALRRPGELMYRLAGAV